MAGARVQPRFVRAGAALLLAAACTTYYPRWANGATDIATPAVVFLGDSLTAGQGVSADEAYPALIASRMRSEAIHLPVVNAGVSGDTMGDGLMRVDKILSQPVAVLVVALGGNDGRLHLPVEAMRKNLEEIVARGERAGASVVIAGMKVPLSYEPSYRTAFEQTFPDIAREHHLAYVPFLLEGVAGVPGLNQKDGIHPTPEGHRIMAAVVWSALEPVVRTAAQRIGAGG